MYSGDTDLAVTGSMAASLSSASGEMRDGHREEGWFLSFFAGWNFLLELSCRLRARPATYCGWTPVVIRHADEVFHGFPWWGSL
jgi:hypothetical protein